MNRTIRTAVLVGAASLLLAATSARAASARQHRYVGEHPAAGGGFCHIHAPHVHVYAPAKADVLYRQHDGWSYFVGDPVAHGYDGPKYAYQSAHPIHVDVALGEVEVDGDEVEYCYLKGPHYHIDAPPAETRFELRGDIYWYVGAFPPEFTASRPKLVRINAVYEPIVYTRPVVLVGPPPAWVDVLVEVRAPEVVVEAPPPPRGVAVVEGGVGVGVRAGVEVHVPAPVFEMRVGVGAAPVVVREHHVHEVHVHDHGKHRGKKKGHWKGKGRW